LKVAVFFTWDYSLNTWKESNTIERELKFFKFLEKNKNISFSFFTYGNKNDIELGKKYGSFNVYPISKSFFNIKNKFLRLFISFFIPIFFKKEIKESNIIFQNQLLGCWIPIISKFIYKKPLIIRTGYDMLDFAIKDRKPKITILLYKLLTLLALRYADYFTVTSNTDFKRFTTNYPKYKNKILYRPNWVSITKSSSIKKHENRIISVGRLVEQKNYEFMISEFKNTYDEIQLDIIGDGANKEELLRQSKKMNVNVNFLGKIQNERLLNVLKEYKFFISCSTYEGNPKTILEAMEAGCITFVSDIPNHKELIIDEVDGLIFELKENKLREKFNMVKNDIKLSEKISTNGSCKIKNNYSLEKSVELFFSDFVNLSRKYF